MQKTTRKENRRRVLQGILETPLILALVGVLTIVGFFAGGKISEYRWQGLLVQWKRLPASMKFTEIVDATSYHLWARAENGEIYMWDMHCGAGLQCRKWVLVEEMPTDIHDVSTNWMERSASCNIGNFKPREPSGKTTQCVFVYMVPGDFNITSYYALTDTGEIWYWELISDISSYLFTVSSCTCSGGMLGLLLGVIIFYRKTAQN